MRTDPLIREQRIKLGAVLLLLMGVASVLIFFENLSLAFVLAVVVNYLLAPFVNQLERQGVKRHYATAIPFLVLAIILSVLSNYMFPIIADQIAHLRQAYPIYIDQALQRFGEYELQLAAFLDNFAQFDLADQVRGYLFSWTKTFAEDIPAILTASLTTSLLTPFLAFFLLLDGREVSRKFLSLVPNAYFELFLNLSNEINKQIGDFIRARILEAGIIGGVVAIGLLVIGFPYAALLSIFAAVTNLIPYLGPFIGGIPALAIAILNDMSGFQFFLLVSVYLVAHIIDSAFIIPVVVAKIVNLHPVFVILGMIIGAELMGVIGMIIAIPLASTLKVTVTAIYNHMINYR